MKLNLKHIAAVLFAITCMFGCKNEDMEVDNLEQYIHKADNENDKLVIYQVFTRLFGNTNTTNKKHGSLAENGVGKFNDFSDLALSEIKNTGFTHIWYTGVIEHATMTDYSQYGIKKDNPEVVKGRAGSPYAIKDYYDVNPDLAEYVDNRMREFESLVARTHDNGLKVIIDFVPNHVAREYHSDAKPDSVVDLGANDDVNKAFDPNNNFYYLPGQQLKVPAGYDPFGDGQPVTNENQTYRESPAKATGNDVFSAEPSIHDWYETVKLNYGIDYQNSNQTNFEPIPDTWHKMKDILLYWSAKGVDGFRCDMAQMVPVEFWQWVIQAVKEQHPDLVFVAEIYDPSLYQDYVQKGKFDYLYDKVQMYDTLRHLVEGKTDSTTHISKVVADLRGQHEYMLRFLENHDEQRIASADFAGNPWKAVPAMVLSATLHGGPVMVYFGQEVGEPGKGAEGFGGEDGRTTIFDYWGVPEHQKWVNEGRFDGGLLSDEQKQLRQFYVDLLNFSRESSAIVKGNMLDLNQLNLDLGNQNLTKTYSFLRYHEDEVLLITTNFSGEEQAIELWLPREVKEEVGISGEAKLINPLGGEEENLEFDSPINIQLQGYGFKIYKVEGQK